MSWALMETEPVSLNNMRGEKKIIIFSGELFMAILTYWGHDPSRGKGCPPPLAKRVACMTTFK